MPNQVTAINTYSNTDGSKKVLGFDSQDQLLRYIKQEVDKGSFTEKDVLWKGYVPSILSDYGVRDFYRKVNGSLRRTIIKNYFLQAKHVRDSVPTGYSLPSPYIETFNNMIQWLDGKDWILVWQA